MGEFILLNNKTAGDELNMEKIDLKKELKAFYNPTAKDVTLIDVPRMNFIMIDGQGAPESPQFAQSIEALYPIAYGIKFDKKKDRRNRLRRDAAGRTVLGGRHGRCSCRKLPTETSGNGL
jgi:hypothetical protein